MTNDPNAIIYLVKEIVMTQLELAENKRTIAHLKSELRQTEMALYELQESQKG